MSGTDNKHWSKADLIRYRAGKMSDSERNAFEKEMQRDPFLADAYEGLELVTSEEAQADLEFISGKIQKKGRRLNVLIYSGAAAAIILLIVSSIWLFQTGRESATGPNLATVKQDVPSDSTGLVALVPESEKSGDLEKKEAISGSKSESPAVPVRKRNESAKTESIPIKVDDEIYAITVPDRAGEKIIRKDTGIAAKALIPEMEISSKMAGVSLQAVAEGAPRISGIIYSKDDSLPLPGVIVTIKGMASVGAISDLDGRFTLPVKPDSNILLVANFIGMMTTEVRAGSEKPVRIEMVNDVSALDEVIVVGYGADRKTAVTGAASTVRSAELGNTSKYRAAEPVCGYIEFNDYIKKNLRYPVDATGGSREVVVIDLPLSESGRKGVPIIVKSPGESFSAEAIRLILAGPEWNPSIMNGITGSDTVRVRIVFQK